MDDRLCVQHGHRGGGQNGIFPVDDVTISYMTGRSRRP